MDYAFALFDSEMNTLTDWGLKLERVSIPLPTPQIITIAIPGANGALDLSEVLTGSVNYNTRSAVLEFSCENSFDDLQSIVTRVAGYLHGKRRRMVLDIDPGHYYYGRFTVEANKDDEVTSSIIISGSVDPYKYELEAQEIITAVAGTLTLTLQGAAMPVVPLINSTAIMTVTFGGTDYDLAVGDNLISEVCLVEGENILLFTGTGTITMTFLRGTF